MRRAAAPEFVPRSSYVGFVVDEVALGEAVSVRMHLALPCSPLRALQQAM
jgi:hypothetical protein